MTTPPNPRGLPHVVFRRLADDEWALYDPAGRRLHTLNLTAAIVWEYCDGTRPLMDVIHEVRTAFGEAPARIDDDVARVVDWFVAEGLMTWT